MITEKPRDSYAKVAALTVIPSVDSGSGVSGPLDLDRAARERWARGAAAPIAGTKVFAAGVTGVGRKRPSGGQTDPCVGQG